MTMTTEEILDGLVYERTCDACPTQYDITLPDGRYVYLRYRHGYRSIELHTSKSAFYGAPLAEYGEEYMRRNDTADGYMSHAEVEQFVAAQLPALLDAS